MRRPVWALLGLLAASPAFCLSGNTVATDNVKARLVSEQGSLGAGQSAWVALELTIRDGWHTYWRNPGDSGEPTKIAWQLPAGVTAGDIVWTTPHRFEVAPLVNYGYAKHAVHLVEIKTPATLKAGSPVTLAAKATWLVCSDVCIPESADLTLSVPATAQAGAADPKEAALFAEARADLPGPAPAAVTARVAGDQLLLTLDAAWGDTAAQIESLAFYPYDEGGIEYAAPQVLTRNADGTQLAMKVGYQPPTGTVKGVLVATEKSGNDTLHVPLEIAATFTGATGVTKAAPRFAGAPAAAPAQEARPLPVLLLFAVLGGLILNLMPCVFPVLSIKAINVVEQAKTHPAQVRIKGLVFAAGVITSMLVLAGVLISLRAGGEQIGWGFQLQSPLFVTLMVYLLMAVGLNLSGVFEVGGGLAGVGDGLAQGDSYRASFFTGVLTTLVATPCTAPFMAAAVGAALTQSTLNALLIFFALGLGLSLPYVLLAFAPWTRRLLPRPGAWMDTLKQLFAFPIYASAAWLLWTLLGLTSPEGVGAALAGLVLVGLAAWAYQKSHSSAGGGKAAVLVTAVVALLLAIALPVRFAATADAAPVAGGAPSTAKSEDGWLPYDAAKLAELTAAGKPLLVNFTAKWCLTCLVNERNAFADSAVQAIFKDRQVTLMKGDWTKRDPAITQALAAFNRAGVPLYVVYNAKPGAHEPVVLPQILTASVVESAFQN